jgi:hypothetical protein
MNTLFPAPTGRTSRGRNDLGFLNRSKAPYHFHFAMSGTVGDAANVVAGQTEP